MTNQYGLSIFDTLFDNKEEAVNTKIYLFLSVLNNKHAQQYAIQLKSVVRSLIFIKLKIMVEHFKFTIQCR